jgi:hypothetical protein
MVGGREVEAVIEGKFMFLHILRQIDLLSKFKFINSQKAISLLIFLYDQALWWFHHQVVGVLLS